MTTSNPLKMAMRAAAVILLSCAVIQTATSAQPTIDPPTILIRGGRLIDPESGSITKPIDVFVKGEVIERITPAGRASAQADRIIDASGRYLLPGFIEMHAHILLHPWQEDGEIAPQYDREAALQSLRLLLAHGITTVRDPGSPTEAAIFLRQQLKEHRIVGPRLYTAGRMLNASNFANEPFSPVSNAQDIRREIDWQASSGVDFIKIYSAMPPELVRVAAEQAHARGLKITGHFGRTSWATAAALGIDGIEHAADWSEELRSNRAPAASRPGMRGRIDWLNAIDPAGPKILRMGRTLARANVFVVPTLITMHSKFFGNQSEYLRPAERHLVPDVYWRGWARGSFTADWSAQDYAEAQAAYPRLPRMIRALHDAGVLMAVGTDMPTPWTIPGVSFHQELRLLSETGISNREILRMATVNGAKALGIEKSVGRIAVGYEADILILTQNPLDNLRNARAIEKVISDGRVYAPTDLMRSRGE